ncbi:uncharacterized protein METZ01_LOCUS452605 [marine metagenome]|uniref:Uncharacterized protein n=1 Tax=marine metagenome TaxID=408172 RepID=A0A382ZWE8_9ZZZZ
MAENNEDNTTEEETSAHKAPTWRSKASDVGDTVQVEYTGPGSYSIHGFTFSSENSVQSVPSHIANLVIATGKFQAK